MDALELTEPFLEPGLVFVYFQHISWVYFGVGTYQGKQPVGSCLSPLGVSIALPMQAVIDPVGSPVSETLPGTSSPQSPHALHMSPDLDPHKVLHTPLFEDFPGGSLDVPFLLQFPSVYLPS